MISTHKIRGPVPRSIVVAPMSWVVLTQQLCAASPRTAAQQCYNNHLKADYATRISQTTQTAIRLLIFYAVIMRGLSLTLARLL